MRDIADSLNLYGNTAVNEDKVICSYTGGFFVALITEGYMDSYCGKYELPYAIQNNSKIIALVLDNCEIPEILKTHHWYRIPNTPTEADILLIVDLIEADLKRVIKGPISYQAEAWNTLTKIQ